MIKIFSKYKIYIILFFILNSAIYPQSLIEKLNRYILEYQKNKNVASISAGVSYKGNIIWLGAQGYADLSNHVPANTKTVYRIASISKLITAVAIMQLVEEHKIDLDADARKYLPYFPKKKWKFTTRQILQHTAGLRSYKPGEFNSTVFYQNTKDVIGVIQNDSLEFKPGTKFLYTTLGYNLLAGIIENVTKMSFVDYVNKFIFTPAGMSSTFPEFHKMIIKNKAKGYDKNNFRQFENAPLADLSIKFAGGGFVSTSEDLLKFANSLLEGKLIKRTTLDSMLVPTKLLSGRLIESGLGFEIGHNDYNEFYFGHAGFGTGFVSFLAIYPKDSLVVVDLINTMDRNLGKPALDLSLLMRGKDFIYPLIPLSDRMMEITLSSNIDSAISYCKKIKLDSAGYFNLSSDEFKTFGYDLLRIKKINSSIKWFKFFINEFPHNISSFIGIADAYYNDGNKGLAIKNYINALVIDPYNKYAIKMINLLKAD